MSSSAPPPLTYAPAYVGLFASLTLGATCNSYLDIQYGLFGFEVLFWVLVFGFTAALGWHQNGEVSDGGKRGQKVVLVLGLALYFLVFIHMWTFPRSGVAMLAMLQAAQNCVTVTRRQVHLGLLASAAMVMFAASHYRADWTMLFYLVPYVTAVVFTLVAEQINRRVQDLEARSLGRSMVGGQWIAIAAATGSILLLGAVLYTVTPKVTWPYLEWRFGQPTNLGHIAIAGEAGGASRQARNGNGAAGDGSGGEASNERSEGYGLLPGSAWPSPEEMREAAKRPGMPRWQRGVILWLADMSEWTATALEPARVCVLELRQSFTDWLKENSTAIIRAAIAIIVLSLIVAFSRLLREAKVATWLRTRFDYLRFVALGRPASGPRGARQIYGAMERLFELEDNRRAQQTNAREFLSQLRVQDAAVLHEATELTRLFEDVRYGAHPRDRGEIARMRVLYRAIYRRL